MDEQKKTCYACVNCDTCPLREAIIEPLGQSVAWVFRLPNKITRAREALLYALAGVCPLFEMESIPLWEGAGLLRSALTELAKHKQKSQEEE